MRPRTAPATRAVHPPDPPPVLQRSPTPPLHRATSYLFESMAESLDLRAGRRSGYVYGRIDNPTADAFATAVAEMEAVNVAGPVEGQAFNSGMAAITAVMLAVTGAGAHVVAPRDAYGGTYGLLDGVLSRFGLAVDFVDPTDPEAVRAAIRPETRVVFAETLANPTLAVPELPVLAELAHAAGALLVVDSTLATPVLCRPLEHGADLVVHSATKYFGGHSDAVGGVVVGRPELIREVRAARVATGGVLAPDPAYLLRRGLSTLPLRMARQCATAATIADAMTRHDAVLRVDYPGLGTHPSHDRASRLFDDERFGAIVTLTLRGGKEAGSVFLDSLGLVAIGTSLGGVSTVAQHVASTTHRQLDPQALAEAGIGAGTVRLSIGLEDPADLVEDLHRALWAIRGFWRL
ncbi:PLP-dependent aspartate aminotransferase family protein [Plantactinospora sp. BB1]|uniref:trans-sulfuration enzyme family protein n=1 Tax=Plantactinospora sp. BB1 TaxID=2071627 RepID=UPI000D1574BB|nr:aminotransferase class I/II-fold pyridoxal phosphate-dependent enzyme [Plantactinospora sp. BB1]AVT41642.1 cystathionine gamma-synthase [Plantactinospora sp. BB1]